MLTLFLYDKKRIAEAEMAGPVATILWALFLGAIAFVLFEPKAGLLARRARLLSLGERVRIEDALKHLHDCEYRGVDCTRQSLAGSIAVSHARAASLLARLQELELVTSSGETLRLTANGRGDALRVIRVHRLWELYLADRTGLPAEDWHAVAEEREHDTSPQDADRMAKELGNPSFDPHGDPIPTASGEIPPHAGVPLTELESGQVGRVVHVEDEPANVFAQLHSLGLQPGVILYVIEAAPHRVRFAAHGQEHVLAPAFAANVTVVPHVAAGAPGLATELTLAGVRRGDACRVVEIARSCRGVERRRLLDLGITRGATITVEMDNPMGDPRAYGVRGAIIALRREQARRILVEPDPETEAVST